MTTASSEPAHKFIVVEGPIGVGKTSLARRLCSSLNAEAVLEQAAQNPFLERFYRNPRAGALPTQLYFLFQRAQQLATLKQQDMFAPVRVADYLLEKDRLFARVTLDDAEYGLYEQVYAKLDIQPPKPDLVVYLQAPVDVLLERIGKRGIDYEQHIERQYLERRPHLGHLLDLVKIERRDPHPAARLIYREPLRLEQPKCLAYRDVAGTEFLGDMILPQPGARVDRAGNNPIRQRLADPNGDSVVFAGHIL